MKKGIYKEAIWDVNSLHNTDIQHAKSMTYLIDDAY